LRVGVLVRAKHEVPSLDGRHGVFAIDAHN
jgi:hypothetical protein